jgi:hypothetical protein
MATAKVKVAMTEKRKLTITAVVVIAMLVVPLAAYTLLSYYVDSVDTVHLGLVSLTPPSQFKRGGEYQVAIVISYKSGHVGYIDHEYGIEVKVTLTVISTILSWVSFSQPVPYENGTQTPNFAAIQPPVLIIKVPQTVQAGNYSLTVWATNSGGSKSSATFNFTVS